MRGISSWLLTLCWVFTPFLLQAQWNDLDILDKNQGVQAIAQDSVNQIPNHEKKGKNLKFSFVAGPGYTPDYGFLIGGDALFTFSTDPQDSSLIRSVVPLAFAYFFNGGGTLFSRPQIYFKKDTKRLFGQFIAKNNLDNYYGVGFESDKNTSRSDSTTQYRGEVYQINPILLFRMGESDFFLGPQIDLIYERISEPSKGVQQDAYYIKNGGDENGLNLFSSGVGLSFSFDTRDMPANAYTGVYINLGWKQYLKEIASYTNFGRVSMDYRQFLLLPFLGERKVLAWRVQMDVAFGDVPMTRVPIIGSPYNLRGYYQGQFRDNATTMMMVEYRSMFNSNHDGLWGKMVNRLGWTVFGGLGFMGPKLNEVEGVLPNYGGGVRIELQPRLNVRLDYGIDTINQNGLFYFNITEAF